MAGEGMNEDEARFRVMTGKEPDELDRKLGFDFIPYQLGEKALTERENGYKIADDNETVEAVSIPDDALPEFKTRADLRNWLIGKFNEIGNVTINSTGANVEFNKTSAQRAIKNARQKKNNIAYPEIEKVVSGAKYSGFREADERHQNVKGQDVYHSGVVYKGVPYSVEFYVDVPLHGNTGDNFAGNKISKIEIAPTETQVTSENQNRPANNLSDAISNISLAVLRGKVKPARYDASTSTYYQVAEENARLDAENPIYNGETININGQEKTVYNSNGDRIAQSAEALRNFYKWFGDSKAVDEKGRPLVVYHGTYAEFDTFDKEKIGGAHDQGFYGRGFYFSRYKGEARSYGSKVMPVYLKISKPFDLEGVDSGKYSGMNNIFEKGAILLRQLGLLDEEQLKKLDFYEKTKKDFLNKIEVFPPSENQNVWFGEVESPSGQKILERAWESDNTKDGLIDVLWNKYTRYIKYDDGTYFQYILDGLSFTGFMRDDGYRPNEFTEKLEKLGYDGVYQGDEFVVFEPNQIKSVYNRGTFSPESDNIYYQRGRGYVGYSMSVNMAEAQEENRLPASKAAKALGVSTQAIKETIPTSEWHHASSYYNKVDVYDINPYLELKAGKELSTDEYSEEDIAEYKANWEAMKAFPKPDKSVKQFYGDAEWLEWSGSRARPKVEEHKETGILIEEKGSFYTFHLPNGTTVKKKIGSNGTYVKSEEEKARQKYTDEMYDAKIDRLTQISKAYEDEWNSFLAEKGLLKPEFEAFEKYWTESNRDRDNFYIEGQKPYSEYKETGLRRIHKETDDNLNDWYILQEWDGEKWNDLEKREEYQRAAFDAEMVPSKKSFLRQRSKDYERLLTASSAEEIEQELQRQKSEEEQEGVYYQGQIADNAGAVELTINTAEETAGVSEDEFKQKMLDTLKSFKGNKIFNQSLGGEIEIRTSSIKKYKSFFADKNKRLIVPYIPELLAKARFVSENTYTPETEKNVIAYWKADLPINIDSDTYNVHLTVKQDDKGNFFWDAQVQEKARRTVSATNPSVGGLASDISEDTLNITPLKQNVDRNLVVTHATTLDKNVYLTVKKDNHGNLFWDAQVQEKSPSADPATNPGVKGLASDISEDTLNITPLKQNVDRNLVVTHATTLDKNVYLTVKKDNHGNLFWNAQV